MIELFKILNGIYDPLCVPQFDLVQISEDTIRTRGNKYELIQHHGYYDLTPFPSLRLPLEVGPLTSLSLSLSL